MGEWGKPRAEAQQWLLRLRLSGRAPGLPTVIQTGVSQEDSLSAPGPATGTARPPGPQWGGQVPRAGSGFFSAEAH